MDHYIEQRDEVLSLIDKKFSEEDNWDLKAISDEIIRVAFGFPSGKSPGGDDVTYDFLQKSWDLVGVCCVAMV